MSLPDTGALRASAISCAFWLTLPFLVRTVRIASLKLFCLPCRLGVHPFMLRESLRACHRSLLCRWFGNPSGCGIGDAGFGSNVSCVVCSISSDRSGNLKVAGDGDIDVEVRRSVVMAAAVPVPGGGKCGFAWASVKQRGRRKSIHGFRANSTARAFGQSI